MLDGYEEYHKMMNEPRDVEIPQHWIHMGTSELYREWYRPVHNYPGFNKPLGGVWASPLSFEDGYVSDWDRFASENSIRRRNIATVFELKKFARIYVIDTQMDLMNLVDEVGRQLSPFDFELPMNYISVDFVNAATKYDVIYLTSRGQWCTRMPFINREYNLYGWDCESCVILNFDVIARQRSVKLSKKKGRVFR